MGCTVETATIEAGARRLAAERGLALAMPDTSPRGTGLDGTTGDGALGEGAGFRLDATRPPWSACLRMESQVADEPPALRAGRFPADTSRSTICGHPMGGHGALTLVLQYPQRYRLVCASASIVAPMQVPRGHKALAHDLGDDPAAWARHDACARVRQDAFPGTIPIGQGEAVPFLSTPLQPERLERACAEAGQPPRLRRHAGDDHGSWFIASFIDGHLRHHASALGAA